MIVFWHKRDLRLIDNAALHAAYILAESLHTTVYSVYIFEPSLYEKGELSEMHREGIQMAVSGLKKHYEKRGGHFMSMKVRW